MSLSPYMFYCYCANDFLRLVGDRICRSTFNLQWECCWFWGNRCSRVSFAWFKNIGDIDNARCTYYELVTISRITLFHTAVSIPSSKVPPFCFSGESIDVLGPMAVAVFLVSGVDTAIRTFKLALSYFLIQRVPNMNSTWHCCNIRVLLIPEQWQR